MKIFGVTFLVLATLGLAACGGSSDESGSDDALREATDGSAQTGGGSSEADGEQVFAANCATCHTLSAAGAAGAVGPNLDEAMPSEATVKSMVTNGGSGMPSFQGTLEPNEIDAVARYVSTNAGK